MESKREFNPQSYDLQAAAALILTILPGLAARRELHLQIVFVSHEMRP